MIDKLFFDNYDGRDCYLYVLHGNGIEVGITDFGAAVQFIRLHTKEGIRDIALGYPTVDDRLESGTYCGATIGRVANRIANSQFVLNGRKYKISSNDGKHCNHGGKEGFDSRLFTAEADGDVLRLSLLSPDKDQGFPGNFTFTVEYQLLGNSLEVRYFASSDKDTLWSPTCHIYFNLNGEGGEDALSCLLKINSQKITLLDKNHIATGEIAPVSGTPFDFGNGKSVGQDIDREDEQLVWAGGYDVNYVLDGAHAASASSADGIVKVDVYTDLPGLQLYSGNYIKGKYGKRSGFCLEPQYFPNAANVDGFKTPLLKANKIASHFIRYEFDFPN